MEDSTARLPQLSLPFDEGPSHRPYRCPVCGLDFSRQRKNKGQIHCSRKCWRDACTSGPVRVGEQHGRWSVIGDEFASRYGKHQGIRWFVLCRCACGTEKPIWVHNLRRGISRSCGCWALEKAHTTNRTHGGTKTLLYRTWGAMRRRCSDPKLISWERYGGRGIRVCAEWQDSFETFREWACSSGYEEGLSIDRIDVDKNYEPSNCRWVLPALQHTNKSTVHLVTAFGETKHLAAWLRDSRCVLKSEQTLRSRLHMGWTPEEAVSHPVGVKRTP